MTPVYSGKVREIYQISPDRLVIVTTDRISAFDHILPKPIPGKGAVLNQLSNFWFAKTGDIVPNHILSHRREQLPAFFRSEQFEGRAVMVQKLKMLPFEFIVRGYLFGSMWKAYQKGRPFCGTVLPEGCALAQALDRPILTPARKRDVGHDEYITMDQVSAQLGEALTRRIEEICFRLYHRCGRYAGSRGLIIADAKFEFGQNQEGQLVLGDELFTPDSSRYWDKAGYQAGISPPSFDKQLLRDWLTAHRTGGQMPFADVPESVLNQTAGLYRECLRRLVE